MGLIITNGGFSNFKYYELGILGIQVMIMDLINGFHKWSIGFMPI